MQKLRFLLLINVVIVSVFSFSCSLASQDDAGQRSVYTQISDSPTAASNLALRRCPSAPLLVQNINTSINQQSSQEPPVQKSFSKKQAIGIGLFVVGAAAIGFGAYYLGKASGELKDGCAKMDNHCTTLEAQCKEAISLAKWAVEKCVNHGNRTS